MRGLVTAESVYHEGGLGSVYRYDDAGRLVTTYSGVDLWDDVGNPDNLTDMADPANTPTNFAMRRDYNLDPRGNRTGTGVADSDENTDPVRDHSYTVGAGGMNTYSIVDGNSITYDAIEQMTQRPGAGSNGDLFYDYKGNLLADGTGAHYQRDNQGHLAAETSGNGETPDSATVTLNTPTEMGGSCSGGGGDSKLEEILYTGWLAERSASPSSSPSTAPSGAACSMAGDGVT